MIKNIYKSWETSLIGVILFTLGGTYLFKSASPDYIILSILLIGGVAFLLFPNDIVKQLKSFITKKSNTL